MLNSKHFTKTPSKTLEKLFNMVKHEASITKLHGKAFWQPIKKELCKYTIPPNVHWKKLDQEKIISANMLPEYDQHQKMILENHFLKRQFMIPTTYTPSYRRIIQVALNIGLMEQFYNNNTTGLKNLNDVIPIAHTPQLPTHLISTIQNIIDHKKNQNNQKKLNL